MRGAKLRHASLRFSNGSAGRGLNRGGTRNTEAFRLISNISFEENIPGSRSNITFILSILRRSALGRTPGSQSPRVSVKRFSSET